MKFLPKALHITIGQVLYKTLSYSLRYRHINNQIKIKSIAYNSH